jgi:DNA ligase-1
VEQGAEGIMCKDPRAPYKAGSRGFAWIKFKTDYTEALVDTMDLVAIGAFYGRGRRAGWYGALLMAAFDPETGTFPSVCKLGTGFDDVTLEGLKPRFEPHVAAKKPKEVDSVMEPDVWFEPALVMEVQAAELTLSPIHRAGWGAVKPGAGIAARFPRFTGRWRDDKSPQQATSVQELLSMQKK